MLMRKLLLLNVTLLLMVGQAIAQRTVTGTVTDTDGLTLPGATVSIKGTTTGTITGVDGNYSLTVNEGDVIVFAFLGYETQEIPVGSRSVIDISLSVSVSDLDEVVVIAYGETEKRKFTGSLQSIDQSELQNTPQGSFVQMIQGRASGVLVNDGDGQPGSSGGIVIRGVGTLTGETAPLYIIDGIATSSLVSLNPNDIESISVLKDAAAKSIYGSRAANGVVLITTKQGQPGKTEFTFSAQYGFTDLENPNDYRVLDAFEYTELYREAAINSGVDPDDQGSGSFYLPTDNIPYNTNWLDDVVGSGNIQQYELSASGGNENNRFHISASYYNEEGLVLNTEYERFTGRMNYSFTPSSRVTVDLKLLGSYGLQGQRNSGDGASDQFVGSLRASPREPVFADENTPIDRIGLGYNFDLPSNANHNPIAAATINQNSNDRVRVFPTVRISYEPIDNLTLTAQGSIDWSQSTEKMFESRFYRAETDNGVSDFESRRNLDQNFYTTAKYDFDISPDHSLSALVGFEMFREEDTELEVGSRNFAFDAVNVVSEGTIASADDIETEFESEALISVFSRFNYAYKDKIFADISVRRDGSSTYAPQNRYDNFYAIGLGYDLTNESFVSGLSWLSNLRLKASYGISGISGSGDFAWRRTYKTAPFNVPTGSNTGSQPETPGNPGLRWEQAKDVNFTLDFGLLNDRISASVEYYQRSSIDLVSDRIISQTSGFSSITQNIGEVENKGVEVNLSTLNLTKGDFSWESNLNVSFNKNEVVELNGQVDTLVLSATRAHIVGQPINSFFLVPYAGVDIGTGQALYFDENGEVTPNVPSYRELSGRTSNSPKFYGGFTNTFRYKNLSLSTLFYFRYGTDIYRSTQQVLSNLSGRNVDITMLSRWQQPGDNSTVPRAALGEGEPPSSTRFLADASYIRLRNVTLAYTVPESISSRLKMSNVTLSIRGVNVLTFTDYRGFNVDTGSFEGGDTYPNKRTITFGLSANF